MSEKGRTNASLVVLIWVSEMEIPMQLSIVKFHSYCVVGLLVNSPNRRNQI